jgi:hypothetical protein
VPYVVAFNRTTKYVSVDGGRTVEPGGFTAALDTDPVVVAALAAKKLSVVNVPASGASATAAYARTQAIALNNGETPPEPPPAELSTNQRLDALTEQVAQAVVGAVPDGTLTGAKLQDDTIPAAKFDPTVRAAVTKAAQLPATGTGILERGAGGAVTVRDPSTLGGAPGPDSITLTELAPNVEAAVTKAAALPGTGAGILKRQNDGTVALVDPATLGGTPGPDSITEGQLEPGARAAITRAKTAVTTINGETPDPTGAVTVDANVTLSGIIAAGAALVDMDDYDGASGPVVITLGGKSVTLLPSAGAVGGAAGSAPGQVAKPTAVATDPLTADVTWTTPGSGANPITGYQLQFRPAASADDADWTPIPTTGTGTTKTATGLTAGGVVFRVRAGSISGYGLWSPQSDSVTIADVPAGSWSYDFSAMPAGTALPARFTQEVSAQPLVITDAGLQCPTAAFTGEGVSTILAASYGTVEVIYSNMNGGSITVYEGQDGLAISKTTVRQFEGALWPPVFEYDVGTITGTGQSLAIITHPAGGSHAGDWVEFFKNGVKAYEYEGVISAGGFTHLVLGMNDPNGCITEISFTAA